MFAIRKGVRDQRRCYWGDYFRFRSRSRSRECPPYGLYEDFLRRDYHHYCEYYEHLSFPTLYKIYKEAFGRNATAGWLWGGQKDHRGPGEDPRGPKGTGEGWERDLWEGIRADGYWQKSFPKSGPGSSGREDLDPLRIRPSHTHTHTHTDPHMSV